MFRKYYKEANNDIKADEEFINSVIKNAHKQHAPLSVKKYYKYIAPLAAAVLVVSAAVISMPILTNNNDDGVIIEETIVETAQPKADTASSQSDERQVPDLAQDPQPQQTAPTLPKNDYSGSKTTLNPTQKNTNQHSYNDYNNSKSVFSDAVKAPVQSSAVNKELKQENEAEETTEFGESTDSIKSEAAHDINNNDRGVSEKIYSEERIMNDEISSKGDKKNFSSPYGGDDSSDTTSNKGNSAGGGASNMTGSAYESSDYDDYCADVMISGNVAPMLSSSSLIIPSVSAPSGYYCTSASWDYYIFTSDSGAVITVSLEYSGGEDKEPSYSVDGDNISAHFTLNGVSVDINASGAEKSSVEEIVNSLR